MNTDWTPEKHTTSEQQAFNLLARYGENKITIEELTEFNMQIKEQLKAVKQQAHKERTEWTKEFNERTTKERSPKLVADQDQATDAK